MAAIAREYIRANSLDRFRDAECGDCNRKLTAVPDETASLLGANDITWFVSFYTDGPGRSDACAVRSIRSNKVSSPLRVVSLILLGWINVEVSGKEKFWRFRVGKVERKRQ